MRLRGKTTTRLLVLALLVVVAVGLIAPRLDAGRFGQRVKASLEQALGREVEIGKVRLDLFNGPGFSVEGVVIHDDPGIGLEPLAYVESLEARVSFSSFWTGKLEFSNLRLVNPSINLARRPEAGWNFQALLTRTVGAAPAGARLPVIQVRGGRINFRNGDTKSIFYFIHAEIDATPPSVTGGEWRLRFEGEPARTDRPAYGFGSVEARGRWRPDARTGGSVEFNVNVDRNALGDLIRLVHGHDIGLHGQISLQARLSGPVSDVRIAGRAQLGDIHRWDLMPSHGDGWPVDVRGRLDMVRQTLEVETVAPASGALPVSLRLRVDEYLSQAHWGMLVTFNSLPLAPLPSVARHMGVVLPESLVFDGELSGVLGYSPEAGIQGAVAAEEAGIQLPETPALRLKGARVVVDLARLRLQPASVRLSDVGEATLEAEYSWEEQTLEARISTGPMAVSTPEAGWVQLFGEVPVLQNCRGGEWRGQLTFRWNAVQGSSWTGAFSLGDAQVPVPGLAEPVLLTTARVAVRDDGALVDRIAGRAGALEFKGDYRYRHGAPRPHQFRLAIAKADAAELERLLMPALSRRESLLTRALRFGRSRVPDWMEGRHADGYLQVGSLALADLHLENLTAHVRWDGTLVDVGDIAARVNDGELTAHLLANLGRRASPAYRLSGRFRSVNWMGGRWEGKGSAQSSGTGADMVRNLRLEGSFHARSVSPAPDTEFKTVSGSCRLTFPRLVFSDLEATVGEDVLKGQGSTGPDGRLYLELSDGQKQMRLSGSVSPLQLEVISAPPRAERLTQPTPSR